MVWSLLEVAVEVRYLDEPGVSTLGLFGLPSLNALRRLTAPK